MAKTAEEWIQHLDLEKHPEGGYFREVYRSNESIDKSCLPERFNFAHAFATSIYYLLPQGNFSAFHRLQGDETWHLYAGGPLTLYIITPEGTLKEKKLGHNLDKGEQPQVVVHREQWFSAVADEDNFALVGCVMAPGFEFDDLELGNEKELIEMYPQHKEIIKKYSAESLE